MIPIQFYAIGALIFALGVFGWGQHRHSQGVDEERARWETKAAAATVADLEGLKAALDEGNKLARDTQEAVRNIKVVNVTRQGVIEREIKTDIRYLNDCMPAAGVVQWNNVSAGRAVVPSSAGGSVDQSGGGQLPDGNVPANKQRAGGNPLTKPQPKP